MGNWYSWRLLSFAYGFVTRQFLHKYAMYIFRSLVSVSMDFERLLTPMSRGGTTTVDDFTLPTVAFFATAGRDVLLSLMAC